MNNFLIKKTTLFVLLFILTLLCFSPLFNLHIYRMDDIYFDLMRIHGTTDALQKGIFPFKIAPSYFNGYGYGISFFYCPIFIYPASLFSLIGFSTITSFKLYLFVVGLATTFSMYFCTYKINNNTTFALLSTVFYMTAHYKIIDSIYRGALGETLVFIFLPFILLGVHELLYGTGENWFYLAIGMTGILLSHVLATFIMAIYLILLFIFHFKILFKEKYRILNSIKAISLTLLLSAFYWIPMIEQFLHSQFSLNTSIQNMNTRGSTINTLLGINQSKDSPFTTGFLLLAICLLGFTCNVKLSSFMKSNLILGYFFFFLTFTSPFWAIMLNFFPFFNQIQFPWRFNMISTVLLSITAGDICKQLVDKKSFLSPKLKVCLTITSAFLFMGIYTFSFPIHRPLITVPSDYFSKSSNLNAIGAGEYLPKGTKKKDFIQRGNAIKSSTLVIPTSSIVREKNSFIFDYSSNEKDKYAEIPLVYYYGYRYTITDSSGTVSESYPVEKSTYSTILVTNKNFLTGTINIYFESSVLTKVGYFLSLLAVVCTLISALKSRVTAKTS